MIRSILLITLWCLLAVALSPNQGQGNPPDCDDCECSESVAWRFVEYNGDKVKFGPPEVFKAMVPNDPEAFGKEVASARWKVDTKIETQRVFAPNCMNNEKEKDQVQYLKVVYSDNWDQTCKPKANQNRHAWYPLNYDSKSTNYVSAGPVNRFTCLPQKNPSLE